MNSDIVAAKQSYNFDWLVGVGLALFALGLYLSTLAPSVLEADAGEFQFVPWLPGIAHPTGYPLYILLGWLWSHSVPIGEVAWRMNLLSALFGAITVGITYALARRLLDMTLPQTPIIACRLAAALSAVVFAVSPTFWSQAVIAEVYTLQALFITTILWLGLTYHAAEQGTKFRWGFLLSFIFGLGLTHHVTNILLTPALLLYLRIKSDSESRSAIGIKGALIYGLALGCPLLLYLYLPLIAPSTPYATITLSDTQTLTLYDNSLTGFWQHITATVFAAELQPAAIGFDRFKLTWQLLQQQVSWVGIILALGGIITLWQQKQSGLLILTGLTFLTFVTFNLMYFIGDVFVLFIPAWLIVCLWVGIGGLGLSHQIANTFVRRKMGSNEEVAFKSMRERLAQNMYKLVVIILQTILFALPIVLIISYRAQIDQSHNTTASERWQQILQEPLPQAAILVSNDRNEIMPMWYYQFVTKRRPDLFGLFPLIVTDANYANIGRVLEQALASGQPTYFIKAMDDLKIKAKIEPEGTLFRARAYTTTVKHHNSITLPELVVSRPSDTPLSETITLLGYDNLAYSIHPGDKISLILYWQPIQNLSIDYTSYIHIIGSEGQRVVQSDHQPGGNYYPSSKWQVGEILRDEHSLSLPDDISEGIYQLRVGMYYQPQAGVIQGMGDGIEMDQLNIKANE